MLNAPVNTYFDTTPVGRIINRFSNDLAVCDMDMPFLHGNTLMGIFRLTGCFIVGIGLIYWCVIPIPVVVLALFYYLRLYINLQRKLKRLEKVNRSPVLQYTSESYIGGPTIRAYEGQSFFIKRCYALFNKFMRCAVHVTALECWVTMRVQFISTLMNVFVVLFVVSFKLIYGS
jgi:ATP-binding cassette subfamily C (CFTR/MRP) protein 1